MGLQAQRVGAAGLCRVSASVRQTVKVGAVDCASKPGRELCDRESVVRLPSVRLYADGARDTLAGPAALARGDGCAPITLNRFEQPGLAVLLCLSRVFRSGSGRQRRC